MSDSLFPPEMAKYELSFDFATPADSIVTLVAKVWEINSQIEAAKTDDSGEAKVANHPFDVKASKDKKAAEVAQELINAFIAQCDIAIGKNRNVAWHLAQTDSTVTQYLTSEMQYWRIKAAPAKAPTSGSKLDELREDRKVLTQLARKLLDTFPQLATDERFVRDDKGNVKLPNLQGAGSRSADTPTGRYAKYRQTIWTIDGKKFPIGTDPRDLVRAVWQGAERVGKKPSDLFGPIDEARKTVKSGELVSVTINNLVVTYQEVEQDKQ